MRLSSWRSRNANQSPLLFLDHNAKPTVPSANPATDAPYAKKFKKKVDSSTLITIKKGRAIPRSIRSIPRLRSKTGDLNIYISRTDRSCLGRCVLMRVWRIIVQPARHKMARFGLKVGGEFHVTQTGHEMRAARVEATSRGRIHQTRRLTGRHLFERFRIACIRVRSGCKQGMRIRM